ncbi:uncharacterized protein LOC110631811 [Hevea brasiliensis]|uniref:uncharacterized protein LOC110631811 n=1 Tax=Hevea brasiliensis TaxID=3981 RepID=UPI0025E316BC|nr:uncharacterized protein LOC110631811 [Hevea brasiliensis]
MVDERTLYQLDCSNGSWTVYQKDLPYRCDPFLGCITLSDDRILYMYDTIHMRLDSYDVANRKELPSDDLPRSFWFGHGEEVELIVLAKDRFCVIWHVYGYDVNEMCIYYTRFSVSSDLPKPTVTVEDNRAFPIRGVKILNIVTLDPHSDAMANDLSYNSRVDNWKLVETNMDETGNSNLA